MRACPITALLCQQAHNHGVYRQHCIMTMHRCKPACLPVLLLLDNQEALTNGLASLLHHHFIVRQSHEDELLHSALLMTDHLTVERVLCNAACMCARIYVVLMPNMQWACACSSAGSH